MKNIDKYIISKLSSSFFTVMIGLLSLAWLSQVLKLLDEIVMRGADLSTFFMLSVTVLPNIISQIIPLAAFITSAFVLYSMSSDKEIIILLSSGIQLIFIGLLGEYIGNIFFETKNRPLYIIDERLVMNER